MNSSNINLRLRRSVASALGQSSPASWTSAGLLSSMSFTAVALIMSQPAMAAVNCPPASSGTTTCTVQADQGGTGAQVNVDFVANTGVKTGAGSYGGNYTVINNGAALGPNPPAGIFVRLKGGFGSSDTSNNATSGGNGGQMALTNSGTVSVSAQPASGTVGQGAGIWDDGGAQYGLYGASVGGNGANAADTVIGGGNGGNGGAGSSVTIGNTGNVTVSRLPSGGVGIYGASIGGNGGNQDDAGSGDQNGGNGGNSSTINITNSNAVLVQDAAAGLHAWGIGAESIGGTGGSQNGNGGSAGVNGGQPTIITNSARVEVNVQGSTFTNGVRGLYLTGQGGNGLFSSDGSDNGGAGGSFGALTIVNNGQVIVTSNALTTPTAITGLSGGIVAVGVGGNGGAGPQTTTNTSDRKGGTGGTTAATATVTMNQGSSIITTGNFLPGVSVLSKGGDGGDGREDTDGNNGGNGGAVQITLNDNASISTSGTQSHGLVGRSYGGAGGGVETSSGIVQFTTVNSGVGGAGGTVNLTTSPSSSTGGNTIGTGGDYAIGILGQSMGGLGGSTTKNFEFFGNAGADAGQGGKAGTVLIDSGSSITTAGTSAHGIVGQAIGGGGGTAGASGGIVSVGGAGGTAVAGGAVTINQSGNMALSGTSAIGVLAQSVGGGGGDGGSGSGVIVIGGQGGGGGAGGQATTSINGYKIQTLGDQGYGVVTQAIGGGGGTGGAAYSFDVSVGFALAVAVGGTGGNGGQAGQANSTIANATVMTGDPGSATAGSDAHAVLVQSIGGGGGAGGASVARAVSIAVPDDSASFGIAASFAVGGTGGDGGTGSTASAILNNSIIQTYGPNAMGAVVQSIGGGGGVGGSASATSTVIGEGKSLGGTVQMALGGSGGAGNTGGNASLALQGSQIATAGDSANAILVQSVGGGGGAGGVGSAAGKSIVTQANIAVTINVGGAGKAGGDGGQATLTMDEGSVVTTRGDSARGALVQSIGGGGGASQGGQVGLAATVKPGAVGRVGIDSNVAVGRGGEAGGNGGAITLASDGQITTYGADADGLLVQSIGGSGGIGGAVGGNKSGSQSGSSDNDLTATVALNGYVGGNGGGGGNGGAIGSTTTMASLGASTQTFGDYADAVVLQSIGGGGGAGGASTATSSVTTASIQLLVGGSGGAGGTGGPITAFLNGNGSNSFNTSGYGAMGILMQSIGGGGGTAGTGSPVGGGTLSVGGYGGNGGTTAPNTSKGGSITVADGSYAAVQTRGDSAYGIVLQSVGGGGGIVMAGNSTTAGKAGNYAFDLNAGATAGGGDGGAITASTGLNLNTSGDRAIGVIAQSIGSGGGIATAGAANATSSLKLGGGSSNGGPVTLNLRNNLTTQGAGAHGVVAQSIGGGGGIVGDTAQPIALDATGFKASTAGSGAGGIVNVAFDGSLTTSGTNAHGIVAQSIGGGGGLGGGQQGGFAGSTGGGGSANEVSVTVDGALTVVGAGASGVFAQSQAMAGVSPVSVTINGNVQGGSGTGSGVWIDTGFDNRLTINAGGSLSALSGVAARYTSQYAESGGGVLLIDNYGSLQGSTLCANGDGNAACEVTNHAGGVASGAQIYEANVRNFGLLVLDGPGRYESLVVSGTFSQSSRGVLRANVDFDKMRTSQLVVQGDAVLDGSLEVVPSALLPARPLTVLTAQGATQGSLTPIDSPVFNYETQQSGQNTTVTVASADFAAPSLNLTGNQRDVAANLQRLWDKGGNSALAPFFAQLDLTSRQSAATYRDSIASLSPGASLAPAAQSAANLAQFTNAMMSCPTFSGTNAMTHEQNCAWGLVTGRSTRQDASKGVEGFDFDTVTYQFGGQREVSPGWFVGGSAAYQDSHLRGSNRKVSGNGDSGYVGAVIKRETGPWVFSGALGGGYGQYKIGRSISISGYEGNLKSRSDIYGMNARLRAARFFDFGNDMYIKPYVDLDASYTKMPGYKEAGSNPLALQIKSADQFIFGLSPMIEFGGRKELANKAFLRPFVYVGMTVLSKNDWKSGAKLRGAPNDAGAFDTSLPIDSVVGRVGAGLQLTRTGSVDFRLQYDGQFSKNVRSNSATLKVMMPF